MMVALMSVALLLGATAVPAQEASLSDELFELWTDAYEAESVDEADFSTRANLQWQQRLPEQENNESSRSLTPHLDRLLGTTPGDRGAIETAAPQSSPRPLGHEDFFENPLTTQGSSKGYHGSSNGGSEDPAISHNRDHRERRHRRGSPRHDGHNGARPTPNPEPGTLILAGMASVAALKARRRARRGAVEAETISD
jgi:hypothetical protein